MVLNTYGNMKMTYQHKFNIVLPLREEESSCNNELFFNHLKKLTYIFIMGFCSC